jgi:hypothetical protein
MERKESMDGQTRRQFLKTMGKKKWGRGLFPLPFSL